MSRKNIYDNGVQSALPKFNASSKGPGILFIFFVYILIHISASKSFGKWVEIFTDDSPYMKQVNWCHNWSFLLWSFAQANTLTQYL